MLPKLSLLPLVIIGSFSQLVPPSTGSPNPTKFIDLTYAFNNETVLWPGKEIKIFLETEGYTSTGVWVASRGFCTSEHSSTHIDSPYHFNEHGKKLHEIPLENMIDVPGIMIDIYDKVHQYKDGELTVIENYALTQQDVLEWEAKHGKISQGSVILLRTGWNSRWGNRNLYRGVKDEDESNSIDSESDQPIEMNFPSFDVTAAQFLATERQVLGVGVDTLSVDTGNSKEFLAHRLFSSRNIYMLENVANLQVLPAKGFNLWIVPFKIDFGTGAPTRILAKLN